MLGRNHHTLLLVHRDMLVRADFALQQGGPHKLELRRAPRPDEDGMADLVAIAAAGPPLQRHVWVLSEELAVETLRLDARAVQGLNEEQLGQALAYEAQPFTGIPTGESVTAWCPAGGGAGRSFLVTQMPRADLEQIEDVVRQRGGKLAGLAHPAGLPRPLRGPGAFRRRELWSDVRADVISDGNGHLDVSVSRSSDRRAPREAEGDAPGEWLLAGAGATTAHAGGTSLRLADEDVLQLWLAAWVSALAAGEPRVPLLAPRARPLSTVQRVVLAVVFAALVGGVAATEYLGLRARRTGLESKLATVQSALDRFGTGRTELAKLQKQLAAMPVGTLTGPDRAAWSAAVPPLTLELLARVRPDGLMIDELDLGWQKSSISGRALDTDVVDGLVAALSPTLAGTACSVHDVSRRLDDDGLYAFKITLSAPVPVPAATATKKRDR